MKIDTALILAGGRGTRFLELTRSIPKPMIEAAGKPLLMHIIDIYQKKSILSLMQNYEKSFTKIYQSETKKNNGITEIQRSIYGLSQ